MIILDSFLQNFLVNSLETVYNQGLFRRLYYLRSRC